MYVIYEILEKNLFFKPIVMTKFVICFIGAFYKSLVARQYS